MMSTKLVNELNEMITKLTAMRDDLDPSQSANARTAMRSANVGQASIREFPKNEALESQESTRQHTWGDHTSIYYQAFIQHRHPGTEQTQLPSRRTLRDTNLVTLIGLVDNIVSELQEEGEEVFKITVDVHSELKDSHKQNNTDQV